MLYRSTDGRFLTLAGYDEPIGTYHADLTLTPRVVARIGAVGYVDTTTSTTSFLDRFMSATANENGTALWMCGFYGIFYHRFASSGSATMINSNPSPTCRIVDGQLYACGDANRPGVFKIGNGLPKSASPAVQLTTQHAFDIFFADLNATAPGIDSSAPTIFFIDTSLNYNKI